MYFVFTIFAFITLAAARPLGEQVSSNFSHLDVFYHSPDARVHGDGKVVHIDVGESIDPHKTTMKFSRTFAGAHFGSAHKLRHRPTTTTIATTSRSRTVTSLTTASTIITVPNGTTPIITTTTEPAEDQTSPPTTFTPIRTTTTEPERNVSKPENDTVVIQQLMEQNSRLMDYISRLKTNQTSTLDQNG
ncbi:mucin-5AC-like [Diprion similis]|uniref:mucin-5AC-like n=1 Tax=Diprion similis TaxID=362088 RepID=UPI001EF93C49|nr:mucin-5AC-like [Diprion similis]